VSWVGNFAGAAAVIGLMLAGGSYDGKSAFALLLAAKKARCATRAGGRRC
jgi:hypothetical protein